MDRRAELSDSPTHRWPARVCARVPATLLERCWSVGASFFRPLPWECIFIKGYSLTNTIPRVQFPPQPTQIGATLSPIILPSGYRFLPSPTSPSLSSLPSVRTLTQRFKCSIEIACYADRCYGFIAFLLFFL